MCGIIGFYGVPGASIDAANGMRPLQHRGQEAAGVVSSDGEELHRHRGPGLVETVFRKIDFAVDLPGDAAIGHLRYSTSGDQGSIGSNRSIQPLMDDSMIQQLAVVHNGNLTNAAALRMALEQDGAIFNSRSDTEVILHLAKRSKKTTMPERLIECFDQIEGAYSLLALTPKALYAAVDPYGFRPLCYAPFRGGIMFASETCAFDMFDIPPERVSFMEPGTLLEVFSSGLKPRQFKFGSASHCRHCVFEWVYFARPDSRIWGHSVSTVRERFGRALARRHPVSADIVIAAPDSANNQALAYAKESGIPFCFGLVRSHYIGRTFINPDQRDRVSAVRLKLNPDAGVVTGKSIILVDDSIVRGNTTGQVVGLLRGAGAREVHVRIASPPVIHPCYWGIDTPTKDELIAAVNPVASIADLVGADSVEYLTVEDVLEALNDPQGTRHCLTCFNCKHPTKP
jgi:amidophosphoribosyltransferase